MDNEAPGTGIAHQFTPGEDVSHLSLWELEERIRVYEEEIERLKRVKTSKEESSRAADSVFNL